MPELNPILHQPTRLRVMAFLMHGRSAAVTTVRDSLGLTDGNLAGHLNRLEKAGYVVSRRALMGLHFEMQVSITPAGSAAMTEYVAALRDMLDSVDLT